MKAREVIDAALSDWHTVNVATLADDTFSQLDDDELDRLARRAFTEEWRAALRMKDADGVPRYASIEVTGGDGLAVRVYKQTALFEVTDFQRAIDYHHAEAVAHINAMKVLARQCKNVHGTDIPIPGLEAIA